jgi:hypothetical protein
VPKAMLLEPLLLLASANYPWAMLSCPVVLLKAAPAPSAGLL